MCDNLQYRHNAKGQLVAVPCKTMCHACRIARSQDFASRFKMDLKEYDYIGSFVTLTYNDANLVPLLPLGSAVSGSFFKGLNHGFTLYRPHLHNFTDNLNHKVKKLFGRPIRYIGSGEYGDDGKRPHYHLCILGLPPNQRQLVFDTWNKGMIQIEPIENGAVRYVTEYIMTDPKCADNMYEYWGDYAPQFGVFSKGLGTLHLKKNIEKYNRFGQYNLSNNGDKIFQLNQYYRRKYGFDEPKSFDKDVFRRAKENGLHYFEQLQHEKYLEEERIIHRSRMHGKPIIDTLTYIKEY